MRSYFFIYILVLMTACNQQEEEPAGGPCSYKETSVSIRLIKLDSSSNDNWNALFVNGVDTLYYSLLNNRPLSNVEAVKLKQDSANAATLIIQDIISGHCNPHIQSIRIH